ncbi:MAG: hypothetical protein JWN04_6628 [Myxococcaceae bacterium]|nr:hypothetical protein [Myxococcaceae bacterium]
MEDLSFLQENLPADPRGLEKGSAELSQLGELAEGRGGAELMARARALFASGISDVRVAIYYLWGAIEVRGLAQLGPALEVLSAMIRADFTGFGPVEQRMAYAQRQLPWLLKQIGAELKYHQVKETAQWNTWVQERIEVPFAAADSLARALDGELSVAMPAMVELSSQLRTLQDRLAHQQAALPSSQALEEATNPVAGSPDAKPLDAARAVERPGKLGRVELRATASFFDLLDRMRAFAELLERGDVPRAAIVADDLTRTIENFDPRLYFPELFSEFSRLLNEHIEPLAVAWEERETLAWKVRSQFYQVDLQRFVAGS